jgi:hypothetical protein
MIGVHLGAVAAMDRVAIDEQMLAAVAADVAQRYGLEYLTLCEPSSSFHVINLAGSFVCGPSAV